MRIYRTEFRSQESGVRIQLGILYDTTTGSVHRWRIAQRKAFSTRGGSELDAQGFALRVAYERLDSDRRRSVSGSAPEFRIAEFFFN